MNTKISSSVLFAASLSMTALGAPVSALNGAAHAAGAVNVPVARPMPLPAPSASGSANAAANSTAAARLPTVPPVANPASPGVNANATTHASAQGQANGLAVAGVASNKDSATLSMAETVHSIREANFSQRESVTTDVQTRLGAATGEAAELKARADAAGGKNRPAFATAIVHLRAEEKQVRASLRAAQSATDSSWGKAQSALAHDYQAFVQALVEAKATAKGPEGDESTPKS